MPNRILKESICESRNLSECSFFAQDLYKRLITYADDYGRFNADPQIMLARLYPREMAIVTINDIVDGLIELCGVEKIGFYTSKPRCEVYGAFPHWGEHQRIRDSKKKNPEPTNTEVNDWYLRRYVPIKLKVAILERDNFKCQICGQQIADNSVDAMKLIKMGTGLFHFDHVVPCQQGGRATAENLRLTCAKCNLSRQKTFTVDELLEFAETCENSPEFSASFQNLPPNPIQSESNPNPNPNRKAASLTSAFFDRFWSAYPRHVNKPGAMKAFEKAKIDGELLDVILKAIEKQKASDQWTKDNGQFIPHPATWLNQRRWEDELPTTHQKPTVAAQDYEQRDYSDVQDELMRKQNERILERLKQEGA